MFLKKIHLKDVRCFDDLTLSFDRPEDEQQEEDNGQQNQRWTVILGENGSGKSTILKAIALVTAGSDALAELLDDPQSWIKYRKDGCRIEAILETEDRKDRTIALHIKKGDSISRVLERNSKSLEPLNTALEHAKRNYFVAGYGTSRRLSVARSYQRQAFLFKQTRNRNIATLFEPDAMLYQFESWAIDLDYREEQGGLRVVKEVLNDFLPGVSLSHIDKENSRLMMKVDGSIIPLQNLSDGYQNVAAWIGDLLYRITNTFSDHKSPLKARGLLMIDEVDLHLHPRWQRTLINLLETRLPHFQLIATTHSPMTAQQVRKGQLYYLKCRRGEMVIERFESDPRMLLVHQLLMTDAFGLKTDESKEVEETKNRYRELRDKKRKSKEEKIEMEGISQRLRDMPGFQWEPFDSLPRASHGPGAKKS